MPIAVPPAARASGRWVSVWNFCSNFDSIRLSAGGHLLATEYDAHPVALAHEVAHQAPQFGVTARAFMLGAVREARWHQSV